MSAADDIQVDLAACLLGVFAVLWLTKSGIPPEAPPEQVDLEVRIRAVEKLLFKGVAGQATEFAFIGSGAVKVLSSDSQKEDLLSRLTLVVEGPPASAMTAPRCQLMSEDIKDRAVPDDDFLAYRQARFIAATERSISLKCLVRIDPSVVDSSGLTLRFCRKANFGTEQCAEPVGGASRDELFDSVTLNDGTQIHFALYRPVHRWELRVAGELVDARDDSQSGSYESMLGHRQLLEEWAASVECGSRDLSVEMGNSTVELRLRDDLFSGLQCQLIRSEPTS